MSANTRGQYPCPERCRTLVLHRADPERGGRVTEHGDSFLHSSLDKQDLLPIADLWPHSYQRLTVKGLRVSDLGSFGNPLNPPTVSTHSCCAGCFDTMWLSDVWETPQLG